MKSNPYIWWFSSPQNLTGRFFYSSTVCHRLIRGDKIIHQGYECRNISWQPLPFLTWNSPGMHVRWCGNFSQFHSRRMCSVHSCRCAPLSINRYVLPASLAAHFSYSVLSNVMRALYSSWSAVCWTVFAVNRLRCMINSVLLYAVTYHIYVYESFIH